MLEAILRAANLAVACTTCSHIALVIAERSGCGRKAITSVTAPSACVTPAFFRCGPIFFRHDKLFSAIYPVYHLPCMPLDRVKNHAFEPPVVAPEESTCFSQLPEPPAYHSRATLVNIHPKTVTHPSADSLKSSDIGASFNIPTSFGFSSLVISSNSRILARLFIPDMHNPAQTPDRRHPAHQSH